MSEGRGESSRRPATERADEFLNRAGWTVGFFGSMIGMRLARVAAFAREEAEDMWAEAQSIRQQSEGNLSAAAGKVAEAARGKAEDQKAESRQEAEPEEEARVGAATADAEEQKPEPEQSAETNGEVAETIKATSTARRRAEELGVDLREVEGTGAGGQITASDVRKKAQAKS